QTAEQRRAGLPGDAVVISEEHGIAIVKISGTISPYYRDSVDPFAAANTIRALGANPNIQTVIHDLDTPGGHATGVPEWADAIREVSESGTRTVGYVGPGQMACSAGYWVAAACDEIHGSTA